MIATLRSRGPRDLWREHARDGIAEGLWLAADHDADLVCLNLVVFGECRDYAALVFSVFEDVKCLRDICRTLDFCATDNKSCRLVTCRIRDLHHTVTAGACTRRGASAAGCASCRLFVGVLQRTQRRTISGTRDR